MQCVSHEVAFILIFFFGLIEVSSGQILKGIYTAKTHY